MPKVSIYNIKAEKVAEEELKPEIFDIPLKMEVIQQALIAQMANARKVIAHTKGRSEVRGGGRKPWKQKGTGRARHGSIRSPLWIGGGITFGPTNERNFTVKINKKMKKKALRMALSDKVGNEKFILLEEMTLREAKTKKMAAMLDQFKKIFNHEKSNVGRDEKKILMLYSEKAGDLIKAGKNISNLKIIGANNLNIKDVLNYEYIMLAKDALKVIEALY